MTVNNFVTLLAISAYLTLTLLSIYVQFQQETSVFLPIVL